MLITVPDNRRDNRELIVCQYYLYKQLKLHLLMKNVCLFATLGKRKKLAIRMTDKCPNNNIFKKKPK